MTPSAAPAPRRLPRLRDCLHRIPLLALGLVPASLLAEAPAAPPPPNFLFIGVDDLKPLLGRLAEEPGNFLSLVCPDPARRSELAAHLSPNMDRLAARGVDFRRAYSAAPVCNASRTALLTGIPPHQNGIYENDQFFRASPRAYVREAVTLPARLRAAGYYTAGIGKIFHTAAPYRPKGAAQFHDHPDTARSWDAWINTRHEGRELSGLTLSPWSLAEYPFRFGTTTVPTAELDDALHAGVIARLLATGASSFTDSASGAEVALALPRDRPFFLAYGVYRPHLPFIAPQEFLDRFPAEDLRVDRALYQQLLADVRDLAPGSLALIERPADDGTPGAGRFSRLLRHGRARAPDGDLVAWRECIRHYLASIAYADHCVGLVLDALERSPARDNTIVVLWSDHGWNLGTKFRMSKSALWDETAHCVLTVADLRPGRARGVSRALVSLQDLYPTLCTLAGAGPTPRVAGRDLSPLLHDPATDWPGSVLTTHLPGQHSLRRDNFRLLRYAADLSEAELYDLATDPREFTNLLRATPDAPAAAALSAELDRVLHTGPFPHDTPAADRAAEPRPDS